MKLPRPEVVLLDIEGTICPISFVKDVLFPYALHALPDVAASQWENPTFQSYVSAFPPSAQKDPAALVECVEQLTRDDVKVAHLKNIQGYLWRTGYESGAFSSPLFADVVPALRRWHQKGMKLTIYSSGSVDAQKLLLQYVAVSENGDSNGESNKTGDVVNLIPAGGVKRPAPEDGEQPPSKKQRATGVDEAVPAEDGSKQAYVSTEEAEEEQTVTTEPAAASPISQAVTAPAPEDNGASPNVAKDAADQTQDLRPLFSEYFDTVNAGSKVQEKSYERIAAGLGVTQFGKILFLSDNVRGK